MSRFVAAGCAALTALLAVSRAFEYAFWQDEVGSARVITHGSPIDMLRNVTGTELHPPGFYAIGWFLTSLGAPAVWVRSVSVLAAVALSGLVVLYAQRFMPLWGAAVAGLATSLGWQFVDHAWELRPYSLFALACLLFVLALERAAEEPSRGRMLILALAVAAGAMTHYFFLFTLAGGLSWLAIRREGARLLIPIGLGLVPLVAWLPAAYEQYRGGGYTWIGSFRLRAVVEAFASLFYRGSAGYAVGLLVLAAVVVGAFLLWHHSDAGRLCALCALAPPVAATLVWATGREIFLPRNLIGAAPFAAVAIVMGIVSLPRPVAVPAAVLASVLLVVVYMDTRGPIVPDYDRVAEELIDKGWQEEDPIVLFGPVYAYLHPLDWYLPGSRLEVSVLNGRPCTRVFVVSVGGRGRALTRDFSPARVRRVLIAGVPYRRSLADEIRRRTGAVLATRAADCARVA